MRYQVLYNQGMFQVIDIETNNIHSDYESLELAGSRCNALNNNSAGLLVLVDGQVRQINELELEMLAIIRSMASKLHDAAEQWEMYVKNFPEPAADYRTYADYHIYLKQFGL
jgi:hypothetical protein